MSSNDLEAGHEVPGNTAVTEESNATSSGPLQTSASSGEVNPPVAPILEAVHLKKDFPLRAIKLLGPAQSVHAVEDTSLALYPGKATALVGESGSGKTTVARLLGQLYEPTSGEIRFRGHPVSNNSQSLREYRRHIQYIFQDP
ncbi:MAG TPA: ATP-binding cassette domain-containing protein, partial [Ktedonobacteraceae bacterium]|nr:ATP-binding cassette domain-containing protein [Ktedonobacteraceae bacterium]